MDVGEIQRKLAVWSTEDGEQRLDRLVRMIANTEWLMDAAKKTLASSGTKTAAHGPKKYRLAPPVETNPYLTASRAGLSRSSYAETATITGT